jgi:hypothetical protein
MDASETEFQLVVDFDRGRGDPSRVFRAMALLVDAFSSLDRDLLTAVDVGLNADVVLDNVETGSIKALLRAIISDVPDEALKNADWKKIVGHYLLRAKYLILKWCEDKNELISKSDVDALEGLLAEAVIATDVKLLPAYGRVPTEKLLHDVQLIQGALRVLDEGDRAYFVSRGVEILLNRRMELSPDLVREILTNEIIKSHLITTVLVKKPDYLGRSQWSLQFQGHKIEASIRDKEWLGRFQSRLLDVRPGDSLKVDLVQETYYGYLGEIVHRQYAIDQVLDVIRPPAWGQSDAFE